MSFFGVTAVRWNSERTEVNECWIHTVDLVNERFALTGGTSFPFAELAAVIATGEEVWVMVKSGAFFEKRAQLQVRGPDERLFTETEGSLFDLPTY